jgi:hypothetical protein
MLNGINTQQRKAQKPRGGALPELLKATLLLDKVANPELSFSNIIKLPDREYNKYDSNSIRNRFNYLSTKQNDHPLEFWKLYSKATHLAVPPASPAPYHNTLEVESNDEEEPDTPPAQSRRQRTPDTTILSTPPPSSKNKQTMSGSARRNDTSSASPSFAYNTMFATLEEAQDTGM